MPKVAKALSALEVKRLAGAGLHLVGTVAGLGLNISDTGSRSWILRTKMGSRRVEIGLGSYPDTTLSTAYERARAAKDEIKAGNDPIAQRKAKHSIIEWTFKRCAEAYIESKKATTASDTTVQLANSTDTKKRWKNVKHSQQWENTLKTYAYPKIGSKHVRDISREDVQGIIEPEWKTKTVTMDRVRQRIEVVLDWAAFNKYRDDAVPNPARWRGNLDKGMDSPSEVSKPEPWPALQTKDVQAFATALCAAEGEGAKCLYFQILTACRPSDARGATWSEIDLEAAEWLIPAERMKMKVAHRVPLSDAAIAFLNGKVKYASTDLIFVGNNNKPLSDMTVGAVIKRMNKPTVIWMDNKGKPIVPHGLRSTFATWAQENTNYIRELREHALAHRVASATTQSYERGTQFEKRRPLMEDWARFVHRAPRDNVTSIRGAA
jgi:integrase